MPGAPPTTVNLALPRYAGTDPADFPLQSNAVVDKLDAKAGGLLVDSFPPTPQERDEFLYRAGAAGPVMRMVRIGASWHNLSGSPWEIFWGGQGGGNITPLYGPWMIELPAVTLAGVYNFDYSVMVSGLSGRTWWQMYTNAVPISQEVRVGADGTARLVGSSKSLTVGQVPRILAKSDTGANIAVPGIPGISVAGSKWLLRTT